MTRRKRIVLIAGSVVLAIAATFIGSLAMLTQTERGRQFIVRLVVPSVSTLLPGQVFVGKMSGNLFTDIRLDSLEIREPNGKPFLATGPIRIVYDPRDIIDRRVVIKSLEIDRPVMTIVD